MEMGNKTISNDINHNNKEIEKNYINPIFVGHGGGPLPILNDPGHKDMIKMIKKIPNYISKPKEILIISAHWEESEFTVLTNPKPDLLYDYYGFPEESYNLNFPIRLAIDLNNKIFNIFEKNSIKYKKDSSRDFDHGVFIPLMLIYPKLDIPVTQISIKSDYNVEDHLRLGESLAELAEEGVLILCSGMSFHNMNAFFSKTTNNNMEKSEKFHKFLVDVFTNKILDKKKRYELLKKWSLQEGARFSQPREDHLIPLFVAAGASKDVSGIVDEYEMLSFKVLNVIFSSKDKDQEKEKNKDEF